MLRRAALPFVAAALLMAAGPAAPTLPANGGVADAAAQAMLARGENPWPVRLKRPPAGPLSAMAQLGRAIFFDASLSGSGKMSCATCHQPAHAYGPVGTGPAEFGGADGLRQGVRDSLVIIGLG